jgi:hypothetical protein
MLTRFDGKVSTPMAAKKRKQVKRHPRAVTAALGQLQSCAQFLEKLSDLPDDAKITDAECEALTRLSRSTLWRIEHGLNRKGERVFPAEPLLHSIKMGPKRKVRVLGRVREFVRRRMNAGEPLAA